MYEDLPQDVRDNIIRVAKGTVVVIVFILGIITHWVWVHP